MAKPRDPEPTHPPQAALQQTLAETIQARQADEERNLGMCTMSLCFI
jgi:hypothetical protein